MQCLSGWQRPHYDLTAGPGDGATGCSLLCSNCNGEGAVIKEKDHCKKCEGKKMIKEVKILEVHMDKGRKHG